MRPIVADIARAYASAGPISRVLVWLAAIYGLLAAVTVFGPVVPTNFPFFSLDYYMFRKGALLAFAGANPYDIPSMLRDLRADHISNFIPLFNYVSPPSLTVLLGPFTLLSRQPGSVLWTFALVLPLVVGMVALCDGLPARGAVALLSVLSPPAWQIYRYGQCDGLLALALGLSWSSRAARPGRAGAWASLALVKPQIGVFCWLVFLLADGRRARYLQGLCLGLCVQVAVSCALLPHGFVQWVWWLRSLLVFHGRIVVQSSGIGSLGVVVAAFPPGIPHTLATLFLGGTLVVLLWLVSRHARLLGRPRLLLASLCLVGMLSPYLHPYDLLVLLPPLVVVALRGEPLLLGVPLWSLAWQGTYYVLGSSAPMTLVALLPALALALRPVLPAPAACLDRLAAALAAAWERLPDAPRRRRG